MTINWHYNRLSDGLSFSTQLPHTRHVGPPRAVRSSYRGGRRRIVRETNHFNGIAEDCLCVKQLCVTITLPVNTDNSYPYIQLNNGQFSIL